MNIANKLTMFRIMFTVIIIFLLLFPFHTINIYFPKYLISEKIIVDSKYIISGILFGIACITDYFDGYFARKYNMITNFGKFMDAVADKIIVNSVLIILASLNFISPVIPVIIVFRDCFVDSIRMVAAKNGKVIAAMNIGKVKTSFLMLGITLTLFYNLPFELFNLNVSDFLLITATILALISGIQYFLLNKDLLKQ